MRYLPLETAAGCDDGAAGNGRRTLYSVGSIDRRGLARFVIVTRMG